MSQSLFSTPAYAAALDRLAAMQAAAAVAFAAEARLLCELAEGSTRTGWTSSSPFETVLLDVAGTCVLEQHTVAARIADAEHLVTHLRATLARLEAGTLHVPQARVLIAETRRLDAVTCAAVEARILPVAAELPPGALRDRVRRLVLTLDAAEAARRAARARGDRRVWVKQAEEDGMSLLMALLPAEHVAAVMLSLTEQARVLRAAGDPRPVDTVRADLLIELLTGRRVLPPGPPLPSAHRPSGATPPAAAGTRGDEAAAEEPDGSRPVDPLPYDRDDDADDPGGTSTCGPGTGDDSAADPVDEPPVPFDPVTGEVLTTPSEGTGPPSAPDAPPAPEPPDAPPEADTRPRTVVVVRPPQVVVHVPLATVLGVSDHPGQIEGGALLPAAQVHELLPTAEIRALFVDGDTGRPLRGPERPLHRPAPGGGPLTPEQLRALFAALAVTPVAVSADEAEPHHDPSAALARFVRLRDGACDGIGCSVPASRCELDHHVAYPDGPTTAANLRARSQRCHHAKHAGWTVVTQPDGGTTWTSPATRTYRVHPRRLRPPTVPPGTRLPDPTAHAERMADLLAAPDDTS